MSDQYLLFRILWPPRLLGCSESQTHFVKKKEDSFYSSTPRRAGAAIPGNSRSLSFLLKLFFDSSLKNLI